MRIEKKSYKVTWRVLNQQAKKYNEDKNNEIARVVLFEQEKKNKYSPYKILYWKRRNKNENRLKIFCTMFTRFIFQRSTVEHTISKYRNLRKRLPRRRRISREMETDSLYLLPVLLKKAWQLFLAIPCPPLLPPASYTATKVIRNFIRVTFRETKVHVRYSSDIIVKVAKVYGKKKKKKRRGKEKKKLSLSILDLSYIRRNQKCGIKLNDLIKEEKKKVELNETKNRDFDPYIFNNN